MARRTAPIRRGTMTISPTTLRTLMSVPEDVTLDDVSIDPNDGSVVIRLTGDSVPVERGETIPFRVEKRGPFLSTVWLDRKGSPLSRSGRRMTRHPLGAEAKAQRDRVLGALNAEALALREERLRQKAEEEKTRNADRRQRAREGSSR